jgi:hypothetical protein
MQSLTRIGRKSLQTINRFLAIVDSLFMVKISDCPPPLFILGVPRSGTTLTYQVVTTQFDVSYFFSILNYLYGMPNLIFRIAKPFLGRSDPSFQSKYGKVSGVFSPAETGPMWHRWFPWDNQETHYLHMGDTGLLAPRLKNLKRNLDSISTIMKKPLVIKSVYLSMVVTVLAKIWPEARFIYVQRDLLLTSHSLLIGRQKQKDPNRWWSVKPPQLSQIMEKPIWQQVVEQAYYTDKLLQNELNQVAAERTFRIRYEDLCQDPHHFVQELGKWLAPVGYKQFSDICLPHSFQPSKKYSLDQDIIIKMKTHLETLAGMEL